MRIWCSKLAALLESALSRWIVSGNRSEECAHRTGCRLLLHGFRCPAIEHRSSPIYGFPLSGRLWSIPSEEVAKHDGVRPRVGRELEQAWVEKQGHLRSRRMILEGMTGEFGRRLENVSTENLQTFKSTYPGTKPWAFTHRTQLPLEEALFSTERIPHIAPLSPFRRDVVVAVLLASARLQTVTKLSANVRRLSIDSSG